MLGPRNPLEERIAYERFTKKKEKKHLSLQVGNIYCKMQNMEANERQLIDEDDELHSILKYCVKHKDLERGRRVHAHVLKRGIFGKDIYVW